MSTKRTAEIEIEQGEDLITLTVEYLITGAYRRATRLDSPEWPDIEVLRVTDSSGDDVDHAIAWPTDHHRLDWERAMLDLEADNAEDDYRAAMERKAEERLDR